MNPLNLNRVTIHPDRVRNFFSWSFAIALIVGFFFINAQAQNNTLPPNTDAKITGLTKSPTIHILNEIVAAVDGTPITRLQVDKRATQLVQRLKLQNVTVPSSAALRNQVIERMILDTAQLNIAKTRNFKVDEEQINSVLQNIANKNKTSIEGLKSEIKAQGINFEDFVNDLRNDILIRRVQDSEVSSRVRISELEVDQFLQQNNSSSLEINLGQILIQTPEGLSPEAIEKKRLLAEDILQQLKTGANFARLAVEYSNGKESTNGGNMGWRSANKYPDLFTEAIAPLKTGEVSKIIRSPNGFHILRLIDRRNATKDSQMVLQTTVRHILIKTSPLVSSSQALAKANLIKEKLDKNEASFEVLAQQFSDDGSKKKGGNLGVIFPGDTVPDFENAMNNLTIGVVSVPVKTQFGYHLIQVLERKTDALPTNRKETQARVALYERKYDEALNDWLSQLRGQVHVETFASL